MSCPVCFKPQPHGRRKHGVDRHWNDALSCTIKCPTSSKGIAFDTKESYQDHTLGRTSYQGDAQTHLCCIFNLWRTTAKQLARSSWSHGTCHTNLTLTATSTWYGSIILHYVTGQASRSKCVKNLCFREIMSPCKMIKYCRYNAMPRMSVAVTIVPPCAFSSLTAKA